jgi:hypothetical protein
MPSFSILCIRLRRKAALSGFISLRCIYAKTILDIIVSSNSTIGTKGLLGISPISTKDMSDFPYKLHVTAKSRLSRKKVGSKEMK